MAEKKISELPTTTTAMVPTDVLPADVGGTTYKVSMNQLFLLAVNNLLSANTYMGIGYIGFNAGEALAQWDAVYLDNTSGGWKKADANVSGKWPARGLVVAVTGSGNPAIVLSVGVVRSSGWAWTARNANLYISITPGGLSQSAPSDSGSCIQIVGFATATNEASFNFNGVYALHT